MPIVHVTPLGSSTSDIASAIGQIIDYLQRGSKTPRPNMSPTVGYYADSAEGPGVWRGRGVAGHQLAGPVHPELLREVLSGRHPVTGHQLVSPSGSAGRAERDRPSPELVPHGPPDQLLTTRQAAALLGTSERYVRTIAEHRDAAPHPGPAATYPGGAATYPSSAATYPERAGTSRRVRLQGVRLETGAWAFRRDDMQRFAAARVEPKVVVAYDVTLSVEKSISLAWVHADPDQRRIIEDAIDNGVNAAVSYLEEHALHVRRGRGAVQADGVWAASYRHLTNRHLEPQLHEHILIANVAAPAGGGVTQAIDARGLMHHAKTAGYVAGAVIRNHLSHGLGVEWEAAERGLADIAGVPRRVIDAMSTRRNEIESVTAELGLDSLAARQYVALSTRQAKQQPADWGQLETDWQERLTGLGFGREDWLHLAHRDRGHVAALADTDIAALMTWLDSPDGITRRSAIFTRREVVQHIIDFDAGHGSNRLTHDLIETLADRYLASSTVISVEVPAEQQARTGEGRWYTTTDTLQLEQAVITAYSDGIGRYVAAVDPDTIRAATNQWETATGYRLGVDQQAMIETICGSPDEFGIVVGPAGTGKTAALEVAARAWETAGLRVVGASVTGAAADQLAASTGIASRTVASLIHALDRGEMPFDARTVLVVDEASTLSNRDHHTLIRAVHTAVARMVTVGDPAQHAAVDAGGLWAHLIDTVGDRVARLDTNRRQDSDEMTDVRLANAEYREGRIAAALNRLEAGDRIVTAPTALQLLDDLAADWYLDRQHQRQRQRDGGDGDGGVRVSRMMAEQHTVRRQLNDRAQALLLADGTLTGPGVRIGDGTFHVGDEVVTRTRDRVLRFDDQRTLRNGAHGTVTAITIDTDGRPAVTVDFERRGTLTLDHEFLTRPIRPGVTGGLTPAYAVTTHVAQGSTYAAGRMIASDTSSRAGVYVGLTRGAEDARVYVVRRRDLEPPERSDIGLPTVADTRTALDALADQLTKPDPAAVVAATDPAARRVVELSTIRLADLRRLAPGNPDAVRAVDLIGERVTKRTLNDPPAVIVERFGPRPPINTPHRPIWDQAVRAVTMYRTRYGTEQLPDTASPAQERDHTQTRAAVERAGNVRTARVEVRTIAAALVDARRQLPLDDIEIGRLHGILDRHVAAAVATPAGYLTGLLGKRPGADEPDRQATWDHAATAIEGWRHQHGFTPADGPIGTGNRFEQAVGIAPVTVTDTLRFEAVEAAVVEHLDTPELTRELSVRQ